jgi:hypothetical protein
MDNYWAGYYKTERNYNFRYLQNPSPIQGLGGINYRFAKNPSFKQPSIKFLQKIKHGKEPDEPSDVK